MAAKSLSHKRHKKHKIKSSQSRSFLCFLCLLWLRLFELTESEFAGAALLVFEAGSHLQQTIEHLRTLGAARGEL